MDRILIETHDVAPSKGDTPDILKKHFEWRKTGRYDGPNTIQFGEVKEPVWWNRPFESDEIARREADGMYSYDLPYIMRVRSFKTGYNILVGENSLPIVTHIRIDKRWTARQLAAFDRLMVKATYDALLSLGVDPSKLTMTNNDVLYDGKKFMGSEETTRGGWYGSASVITLYYSKEKDLFDRLTGEFARLRPLTGIMEETPGLFTKERLKTAIAEALLRRLASLDA